MVGDVNQFTDFSSNKNKYNDFSVNLSYQIRQNWAWYSRSIGHSQIRDRKYLPDSVSSAKGL